MQPAQHDARRFAGAQAALRSDQRAGISDGRQFFPAFRWRFGDTADVAREGRRIENLNVNGGSISIGHPFGMTGSRMTGTLANEMARRPGSRYGVVTMCVGGGQGAAALFEAVR